jgi:hypothetical protein
MNNSLSIITTPRSVPDLIIQPNIQFREKFNRLHFEFEHSLAGHPLFEIHRLAELAKFLEERVVCTPSYNLVKQKWSSKPMITQTSEKIDRITNIASSSSSLMITRCQDDPEYKLLLNQIISELENSTEFPLKQEISWVDAYIFVTSPNAITPYHLDHESNFLMQIQGEKDVNVFDPFNRSIVTDSELEHYYIGDRENVYYKPEFQHTAGVYHLVPGVGVHHPSRAPHWVKNGDRVSVSLSINFCLRSLDREAKIYQINHYQRKIFKIEPIAPGKSGWRDTLKFSLLSLLSKRKPANKDELLRSGIKRVTAPFRLGREIANWFKHHLA